VVGEPEYESADPAVLAEVESTLRYKQSAQAAYEQVGPTGTSSDQVEAATDRILEHEYGSPPTSAATTSDSGDIEQDYDPNPLTRQASMKHELVHQGTSSEGAAMFGGVDTPAYNKWWYNPQNWAADEVAAYGAEIQYLQQSVLFTRPMATYH
jgi:hypothetical protein